MLQTLQPISIIVCGEHTPVGKAFLKRAKEYQESYVCIDVRNWLHNPAHGEGPKPWRVHHSENSDSLTCQLSLLNQDAFGTCVNAIVGEITARVEEQKVFVLYCSAGQHRSDGVAKCLASRIFNCGPDESRLFNCAVFSLSHATLEHYHEKVVVHACRWVTEPWCVRRCAEWELWGRQAGECSLVASQMLWFIDAVCLQLRGAMPTPIEEAKKEEPISTAANAYVASEESVAAEPVAAEPVAPQPTRRLMSPKGKPRPRKFTTGRGKGRATKRVAPGAWDNPTSVNRDELVHAHRKNHCPFCKGSGEGREFYPVDDVNAWSTVLEELGVDDLARQDWIALWASGTVGGQVEAMSIVHKLLNKASGSHPVRKPSAFVVSAVGNAWRELREMPPSKRPRRSTESGEGGKP